jgi:hypothetical protein
MGITQKGCRVWTRTVFVAREFGATLIDCGICSICITFRRDAWFVFGRWWSLHKGWDEKLFVTCCGFALQEKKFQNHDRVACGEYIITRIMRD